MPCQKYDFILKMPFFLYFGRMNSSLYQVCKDPHMIKIFLLSVRLTSNTQKYSSAITKHVGTSTESYFIMYVCDSVVEKDMWNINKEPCDKMIAFPSLVLS